MSENLHEFWAAWELFGEAVWVNVFAGACLGLTGVFLHIARLPFLTAALAQAAGLGLCTSFLWALYLPAYAALLPPRVGAALGAFCAASVIARAGLFKEWAQESLAITYLAGLGITLALMTRLPHEISDLDAVLFGSGVAVAPGESAQFGVLFVCLAGVAFYSLPVVTELFVDPKGALVRGVPVYQAAFCLFVVVSGVIAAATTTLGALPVFTLSTLPAFVSVGRASHLYSALLGASALGGLIGGLGYYLAFCWALPVGSAQTLLALLIYGLAKLVSRLRTRRTA